MKKLTLTLSLIAPLLYSTLHAQLPQTRTTFGKISTIEEGMLYVPPKGKYQRVSDSLDKTLKTHPNDTTALFYRALLHYSYNQLLAQPYQRTKGALENLTTAKNQIEKCVELKMSDERVKILRAQIYEELCYRFTADESWMLNAVQAAARRKLFNSYKEVANRYLDELASIYPDLAHEYANRKITYQYRL